MCYVHCHPNFTSLVIKFLLIVFKDEIIPSLEENDGLKFDQDLVLNNVKDKGKSQYKLSYKVLKEEYGYYPYLDIYPYPTLNQLKYYLGGIHHCLKVVGRWLFDSNSLLCFPSQKKICTTV